MANQERSAPSLISRRRRARGRRAPPLRHAPPRAGRRSGMPGAKMMTNPGQCQTGGGAAHPPAPAGARPPIRPAPARRRGRSSGPPRPGSQTAVIARGPPGRRPERQPAADPSARRRRPNRAATSRRPVRRRRRRHGGGISKQPKTIIGRTAQRVNATEHWHCFIVSAG
jgi:hypothetical protein